MIDPELAALLVCPETHQDVALATPDEVGLLNAAIGRGEVKTVKGKLVDEAVQGALVRIDRAVAYPIRDSIPVMLVSEGLSISGINLVAHE